MLCDCNCKWEILIFLRHDAAFVTFPLFSWDRTDLRAAPVRTCGDAVSFCACIRLINIIRALCTTKSRWHFRESMTLLCKTHTHKNGLHCLLVIMLGFVFMPFLVYECSELVFSHAVFCFQKSRSLLRRYHPKLDFYAFWSQAHLHNAKVFCVGVLYCNTVAKANQVYTIFWSLHMAHASLWDSSCCHPPGNNHKSDEKARSHTCP